MRGHARVALSSVGLMICSGPGESVASRLADQDARLNQIIDWGQELESKLEAAGLGTGADS